MDNSKIAIVTGCTGQMGSYFVDFLLEQGFFVVGTARRVSVPNHTNIKGHPHPSDRFVLAPMDLADPNSINNLINEYKPAYFINCAANSFVGSSWDYPEQHMDFNALGVLRQLEAIRRFSPRTRYLNFGSSEEFGDVLYKPQDENHPPRARSPYGASKIAARQIVKVYRESYNLYALQCWCFNYESPRRGPEFVTRKITMGVARIKDALAQNKAFEPLALGNLDAKRDWSHAKDFVRGVWCMLNQETIRGDFPIESLSGSMANLREYVFSSGETHSVREFVERAFSAAKIRGSWVGEGKNEMYCLRLGSIPLVVINPKYYRPSEVDFLLGNSELARKDLNWRPYYTFRELVKEMVSSDLLAVSSQ